jgi:hypothetical protein
MLHLAPDDIGYGLGNGAMNLAIADVWRVIGGKVIRL